MEELFISGFGEVLHKLDQLMANFAETNYDTDVLDNADMKILFKVSDKTLYRWRKKEYLLFYKIGGKFYYPKKILYTTLYQKLLNQYPKHQLPKLF